MVPRNGPTAIIRSPRIPIAFRYAMRPQRRDDSKAQCPRRQREHDRPLITARIINDQARQNRSAEGGDARRGKEDTEDRAKISQSEKLNQHNRRQGNAKAIAQPKQRRKRQQQAIVRKQKPK